MNRKEHKVTTQAAAKSSTRLARRTGKRRGRDRTCRGHYSRWSPFGLHGPFSFHARGDTLRAPWWGLSGCGTIGTLASACFTYIARRGKQLARRFPENKLALEGYEMSRTVILGLTVVALVVLSGNVEAQAAWYVDANATGPTYDGSSWCSAFTQLQDALAEVKTLSGLLPLCSSCKRIRDDQGYWQQIEAYIRDHSEAEFSHSVCPECAKKLYPEVFDKEA